MNNQQQPWYYSWIVIGLALCFIWPVGLALLVMRLNRTKSTVSFGKNQKVIFYVAAGFLFLVAIALFESDSVFMGLVFAAGGAAVIYYTKKTTKQSERFRQYINMIVNQGIESIDTIASMTNNSYDVVVADLNKMVSQGILRNAVIDQMTRTIILPKAQMTPQPQMAYTSNVGAEPPQMVTVTCSGCGAKMVVAKGMVCNCEYCDTPINA